MLSRCSTIWFNNINAMAQPVNTNDDQLVVSQHSRGSPCLARLDLPAEIPVYLDFRSPLWLDAKKRKKKIFKSRRHQTADILLVHMLLVYISQRRLKLLHFNHAISGQRWLEGRLFTGNERFRYGVQGAGALADCIGTR